MLNTLKGGLHITLSLLRQCGPAKRGRHMYLKKISGPRAVTLDDGTILTRADLPPPATSRWVASRKATVVRAVRGGLISHADAMTNWGLSEDELNEWLLAVHRHGEGALKATSVQKYRQP